MASDDDRYEAGLEEQAPAGNQPSQDSTNSVEGLRRELELKSEEAARNYDLYVRERAELENVKKRAQRDKSEALRFANESLVRDLLPVIDNLERAVEHAGSGQSVIDGVRMVVRSAVDVLERYGVKRVEATGQPFDPARHEAIASVPGDEPNRVVQQFLPGYVLHDRLLRPAQVSVSAPARVEKVPDDD